MKLPPFSFAVLDTETSGLVPRVHRVIEYADIRAQESNVQDSFEQLFSIADDIPPHVKVLTRIRPDMLEGKPAFEEKRAEIEERLRGVDLLIGQNLGFDIAMLKGEGIDLTDRPWVDTSLLASLVFPEFKSYSLPYMSGVLRLTHEPAHRALGDVRATLELLARIWERLLELSEPQRLEAQTIMEKSSEGYRMLFAALPQSESSGASWMHGRERMKRTPSGGTLTLETPKPGSVTLLEENLHPGCLQDIMNAAAKDENTCHWIVVKNLEQALRHLHLSADVRVLHPPQLLLDPEAGAVLASQQRLLPEEATLLLKLGWFQPRTRFELAIHGAEKEIWNGRLACAASSPAYTEQFREPAHTYLLDHWQFLSALKDPDHAARAVLPASAHVIVDDASMLEDTATKAYGHHLNVDDLRAAAQSDDLLLRFTDLLALWAEKTRGGEDQHFVTSVDHGQIESSALRKHIQSLQERTDLPEKTREHLKAAQAILDPQILGSAIVWIERMMDGRLSLHAAPRHVDTILEQELYSRFGTTLIVPKGAANGLPEIVPQKMHTQPVTEAAFTPCFVGVSFPTEQSLFSLLKTPPPGKTVGLVGSKRAIEQLFVAHTEALEAQGVTLICQGLSGGQGRMEAEFMAAESPAILLVTPYLYEGFDFPADTVDRLILESVPFDSPNHAVIGRRKERYGNGFMEYCLPRATFRLFRILRTFCRHRREGGDLLVLDRRLQEKDYGVRLQRYLATFAQQQPPIIEPPPPPASSGKRKPAPTRKPPAPKKEKKDGGPQLELPL